MSKAIDRVLERNALARGLRGGGRKDAAEPKRRPRNRVPPHKSSPKGRPCQTCGQYHSVSEHWSHAHGRDYGASYKRPKRERQAARVKAKAAKEADRMLKGRNLAPLDAALERERLIAELERKAGATKTERKASPKKKAPVKRAPARKVAPHPRAGKQPCRHCGKVHSASQHWSHAAGEKSACSYAAPCGKAAAARPAKDKPKAERKTATRKKASTTTNTTKKRQPRQQELFPAQSEAERRLWQGKTLHQALDELGYGSRKDVQGKDHKRTVFSKASGMVVGRMNASEAWDLVHRLEPHKAQLADWSGRGKKTAAKKKAASRKTTPPKKRTTAKKKSAPKRTAAKAATKKRATTKATPKRKAAARKTPAKKAATHKRVAKKKAAPKKPAARKKASASSGKRSAKKATAKKKTRARASASLAATSRVKLAWRQVTSLPSFEAEGPPPLFRRYRVEAPNGTQGARLFIADDSGGMRRVAVGRGRDVDSLKRQAERHARSGASVSPDPCVTPTGARYLLPGQPMEAGVTYTAPTTAESADELSGCIKWLREVEGGQTYYLGVRPGNAHLQRLTFRIDRRSRRAPWDLYVGYGSAMPTERLDTTPGNGVTSLKEVASTYASRHGAGVWEQT